MKIFIFIIIFVLYLTVGLFHQVKMFDVLKRKGYKVDYFLSSTKEIRRFAKLVKHESDSVLKRKYKRILWVNIVSPIVLILTIIFVIIK